MSDICNCPNCKRPVAENDEHLQVKNEKWGTYRYTCDYEKESRRPAGYTKCCWCREIVKNPHIPVNDPKTNEATCECRLEWYDTCGPEYPSPYDFIII